MPLSKAELLKTGVAHQQALVKRLQKRKLPTKKNIIPGGKTLFKDLTKRDLRQAIYNWLRGCRAFTAVTISFAKDPGEVNTKETKVFEFEERGPKEIWEVHEDGRLYLARRLADVIGQHSAVYVRAQKDGIYIGQDLDNTFGPTYVVTEEDVTYQQELLKEMEEEEEGSTMHIGRVNVGDKVPAEEWEPFVEFVAKRTKEYGYV